MKERTNSNTCLFQKKMSILSFNSCDYSVALVPFDYIARVGEMAGTRLGNFTLKWEIPSIGNLNSRGTKTGIAGSE